MTFKHHKNWMLGIKSQGRPLLLNEREQNLLQVASVVFSFAQLVVVRERNIPGITPHSAARFAILAFS